MYICRGGEVLESVQIRTGGKGGSKNIDFIVYVLYRWPLSSCKNEYTPQAKNFLDSLKKSTNLFVENFYNRFQFLDFNVPFQVTVERRKNFMGRM